MSSRHQTLALPCLALALTAALTLAACGSDSDDPAPAPTLTGLVPVTGSTAGGTTVTITGTGLAGATVTFGGTAATVTASTATTVTATTPAHAAGAVDVVATNAGLSATLAGAFTYEAPAPSLCQAYCTLMATTCTAGNAMYASEAACVTFCDRARAAPELWSAGTAGTAGNSLACRTTHVGLAASTGNVAVHCPHAGAAGGNLCGSWCDNYCDAALAACTGGLALHADKPTCMTACAGLATTGTPTATAGDTVQCRINHLGFAAASAANATVHCPHGSITPTGPCS